MIYSNIEDSRTYSDYLEQIENIEEEWVNDYNEKNYHYNLDNKCIFIGEDLPF